MSKFLYGRKFRIYVADSENNAWDVSLLRCTFSIEKVALSTANYAEITIYNLTNDTETAIVKSGVRVIVEAGYGGFTDAAEGEQATPKQYGKIFDGEIIQALRSREDNVNYLLTLVCLDGDSFLNNNILKSTLSAGVNQRQIVEHVTSQATKTTEVARVSPELSTQKLPRGKVFFGRPRDYLNDIARDNGANFWVDDGQVYIAKPTDVPINEAIVLTPKTGLIGTPQQTQEGVSLKCLLNPAVRLMSMIKIDNSYIREAKFRIGQIPSMLDQDGQYQVYKLRHVGDTRGDEWYTEIDAIGRSGKIPLMMMSAMQNPN